MKLLPTLFAFGLVSGSALALAQTQAPGLWENTINVKMAGGEHEKAMADMHKQMAGMPPEQRKQIEKMMASSGVSMGAQGTSVKVCVTKEDVARKLEPNAREGCKQDVLQRSGSTVKYKFQCAQPPSSGEGEITYTSDKAYSGKSSVTTQASGKPQLMNMEMSGKWLAADCGEVKPRSVPAK